MGHNYKLIGAPCAHRGPYTFYKAFKYTKNDITSILAINEFFFVKLWNDSDLISIGELRLLWEDKTCNLALASLRLYILPENTPEGRMGDVHGADEVLAITEKVVIKVEDLLTWITEATNWNWGLDSVWRDEGSADGNAPAFNGRPNINGDSNGMKSNVPQSISDNKLTLVDCSAIDHSDISDEKRQLDKINWEKRTGVIVLSYARYCRYRSLLKRLEGVHDEWLRNSLVQSLGGFYTTCKTTKVLFCKDTFDYPELEGHELLCNHLAPKLRSRLPKRKKTLYPSPDVSETDSTSNSCSADEDERIPSSASSTNSRISVAASRPTPVQKKPPNLLPLPIDDSVQITAVDELKKQKAFTQNLFAFMRAQMTPIGKLPHVGNKELNLFEFYNTVKVIGGYGAVCANKLWKFLCEKMSGDSSSGALTPAIMKKHYEKYLLPYERHLAQQFKQTNNNQILVRQQPAEVRKSQPTITAAEFERRRMMASTTTAKPSLIQRMLPNGKPGDKENIPMSQRRLMMGTANPSGVDHPMSRSVPAAHQQRPSSSAMMEPEVIDLCVDTPIKRSVPSIAATLSSKRRKLDILREGGLEVTPISSTFGSAAEPDVVTITKTVSIDTDGSGGARGSPYESSSIEILDPRKYTSSHEPSPPANHYRPKAAAQLLDLSVLRSGGYNGLTDDNLIKKITPSLGPNIEISIVPSDEAQRDPKKRKSMQLPIPALRKISTGELTVRNLSMKPSEPSRNNRGRMPTMTAASSSRKFESNVPYARDLRPSVSITATDKAPSYPAPHMGLPMNMNVSMNESLYLAALYNRMMPAAQPNEYFNEDMMAASTYQHPLSFLAGSFLQQQQQQQQHYQQQGSSRNNGVSLRNNDQKSD